MQTKTWKIYIKTNVTFIIRSRYTEKIYIHRMYIFQVNSYTIAVPKYKDI